MRKSYTIYSKSFRVSVFQFQGFRVQRFKCSRVQILVYVLSVSSCSQCLSGLKVQRFKSSKVQNLVYILSVSSCSQCLSGLKVQEFQSFRVTPSLSRPLTPSPDHSLARSLPRPISPATSPSPYHSLTPSPPQFPYPGLL